MNILGISAFYHDSAAAIVKDGGIVAAAQEERFSRIKHDRGFPHLAIRACLAEAGIGLENVDAVVFYDKPLLKFERLLETYISFAPKGFKSFVQAMPVWLKQKLFIKSLIKIELAKIEPSKQIKLLFTEHHQSHAASAFFPSPFSKAAVLCLDGVGEWATTSAWIGEKNSLAPLWEIHFPHSLGLLYSAFTYYTGFKVNSGEYKLMGLAPYGEPAYVDLILKNLIDLKQDGSFRLNMEYFDFATGLTMTNEKFSRLFGQPVRKPESMLTAFHMDVARSIQSVTEEAMLRLGRTLHKETGAKNLCLAGGVALNCVANGRLLREGPFEDIWVQPAAGDAGGALGAALAAWHQYYGNERRIDEKADSLNGSYLGPSKQASGVEAELMEIHAVYDVLPDDELMPRVAELLNQGAVIGWYQGRMEFGPRALGNRSILGDPRSPKMQTQMNLKIKFRESFRPFAPAVLEEDVGDFFEFSKTSPYMLMVAQVQPHLQIEMSKEQRAMFGIDKLNVQRSSIPAVTHVDYSARLQTVSASTNPRFHRLLTEFKRKTGVSVLVNTSFNVRGEPIVESPADAFRCFMRTEIDYLIVENCVLDKKRQLAFNDDVDWQNQFQLD